MTVNWKRTALLAAALTTATGGASAADSPKLEVVATMEHGPGNIAVTADGTVIVTEHPGLKPVIEAVSIKDGKTMPFPPDGWSTLLKPGAPAGAKGMYPSLGIRTSGGLVWMISRGSGNGTQILYAWDMTAKTLAHAFTYGPPQAPAGAFYNDIALAPKHNAVFVADASARDPAIVAIDMTTGKAVRRLDKDKSVMAEKLDAYIDGKAIPLHGALNPITIDAREDYVYYGPMSGTSIYRIKVEDLLNPALDDAALSKRVERYSDKPASAGITMDDDGNIYVADIQKKAIGATSPKTGYHIVVQDDRLLDWPDGLSTGPDGYIYVATNQLYKIFPSHSAGGPPAPPFYIVRFKALGPTTPGR